MWLYSIASFFMISNLSSQFHWIPLVNHFQWYAFLETFFSGNIWATFVIPFCSLSFQRPNAAVALLTHPSVAWDLFSVWQHIRWCSVLNSPYCLYEKEKLLTFIFQDKAVLQSNYPLILVICSILSTLSLSALWHHFRHLKVFTVQYVLFLVFLSPTTVTLLLLALKHHRIMWLHPLLSNF